MLWIFDYPLLVLLIILCLLVVLAIAHYFGQNHPPLFAPSVPLPRRKNFME